MNIFQTTITKKANYWAQKHSDPNYLSNRDKEVNYFYVYILKLSNGTYSPGYTNDLRCRIIEHKNSTTISTAGKDPKLQYFERFKTKPEAINRESELKEINKKYPREIIRLIIDFKDSISELEFY